MGFLQSYGESARGKKDREMYGTTDRRVSSLEIPGRNGVPPESIDWKKEKAKQGTKHKIKIQKKNERTGM
jgi:hypothetical protein